MLAAKGPSATNARHVIASFEPTSINGCLFTNLHLRIFTPLGVSYSLPLHCEQYKFGIFSLLLMIQKNSY